MSRMAQASWRDLLLLVAPGAVLAVVALVLDQRGEPNDGPLWVTLLMCAVATGLVLTGTARLMLRRWETRER